MLDDLDARGRHDEGGGGGNVERVAHVAAGSAGVEDHAAVRVAGNGDDFLAHDLRRADELLDGRPLGRQPDEQPADLRLPRLAGHDVQERVAGFGAREVLAPAEFQEDVAERCG